MPGTTSIICTQVPTFESLTLASYISNQTGAELINHQTAGVVYPGGLEDESTQAGIPSIIGEVQSPHGQASAETIDTSYRQMQAFLRYFNIIPRIPGPPAEVNETQLTSTGNSYSIAQLTDAGSRVNSFIGQNNRLPSFVTIAGRQVPMSDFLYLMTRATFNLNQGNTGPLTQYRVSAPTSSRDQITAGNIQRSEYSNLAGSINTFVQSNGRTPPYINSSRGTIGYESQVYLFSRIMTFYSSQGRLPNFASISPWTGPTL